MKENIIKVSLSDLLSFKKNASFIKSFGIVPIYDYVLFDSGKMIKSNQREFVIQEADFTGTFLIESRGFFSFLDYAKGNEIFFRVDDNKITISDFDTEVTLQSEDPKNFKIPDIESKEKIKLDAEVIDAIYTATKYTQDEENGTIKPFVFIGNKSVSASDAFVCYHYKTDKELPKIIINRHGAEKIGSLTDVNYVADDRYHIFESNNVIFGFIKSEVVFQDMSVFFSKERGESFYVNRKDFIAFNDACVSISPSKEVYPTFTIKNGALNLLMNDVDYNIDIKKSISCGGTMNGRFGYIAAQMGKLLKTATDEVLTFTQSKGLYYITGESGFNALIVEIYYV